MIYINTLYGHEHTIHAAKISSALQRIGWYIWCTKMVLLLHLVQCGGAGWWYHMWMVMVWCYIYTIPNTSPPPLLHQIIIHFAPARAAATKMQLCMYTKVSLSLKPRWCVRYFVVYIWQHIYIKQDANFPKRRPCRRAGAQQSTENLCFK